ncbi:ABC transporter substrate-binding protein [Egicoccus sp. AB-alg2]|uniref:ABC transporter substrate-binding protein n=1 Tax=Egicoccus sp. AB-alg2 TaxID=3242693 RepID=UPI00359D6AE5
MSRPELSIVTRPQGNNRAITSGALSPQACDLQVVEVPVLVDAFRRMVRSLEFDICEMALTTYLCAREHGVPFTALPIFLVRGFHHGAIHVRNDTDIADPRGLEGHAVGVNRGYTVTTGVWARAILRLEYGVELDRVTWALSGDEHVEAYQPPSNVVHLPPGSDLAKMVVAGELPAAINIKAGDEALRPLIPDPQAAALRALDERGFYPINHLVVVRDDVLAAHPGLARDLFQTFLAAKEAYVAGLDDLADSEMDANDRLYATVRERIDGDPLPYGLGPNTEMLETLFEHAVDQQILRTYPRLEDVFASVEE